MIPELKQPVSTLKGVGQTMESKLARLGIFSVGDLLGHFPRRYEDFSQVMPIRAIKPGPVTVKAKLLQVASRRAFRRRMTITEAIASDGTGTIKAVWFNQPYLKNSLPVGTEVFLSGKLEFRNNDLALQSPSVEPVSDETRNTARIVPVYPETDGLTSRQLRGLIQPLLPLAAALAETLPEDVIKTNKLMSRADAVAEMHFPSAMTKLNKARHRLAFEELFFLILTGLVIKQEVKTEEAPKIELSVDVVKELVEHLGFELTDAQRKAAWQVLQDLRSDQPMNRLLEGDVGSGKTVVAMIASAVTIASGYQVALMVPTELLARQHFQKIEPVFRQMGWHTELLLGSHKASEKGAARSAAAEGKAELLIGTHALLTSDVSFNKLGLVIIDEQHRFGVNQRVTLKQKAGYLPHLLSMTATPIPRSLALTIYGDLDISIIDALPPGRKPIETRVIAPDERDSIYTFVESEIAAGRQCFVVCPLIEESDQLGVKSVTAEAEALRKGPFEHRRIGVMHGKLPTTEKQAVMADFAAGKLDILVSTSVIEVGIDIPNASIMIIEAAERFGLAALHQMRGRIGRGKHKSYCFLMATSSADDTPERLSAMERTGDGFRLAQIDLTLRGPGQIYGSRQHGILDLQLADISDTKLVAAVRQSANAFLQTDPKVVKYPQIRERINRLKAVTTLD